MTTQQSSNPQNPYQSFVVEASAGSGKTYQLAKRFLMLVGAGADPSKILVVTFTTKAAEEMRARIISDATELLVNQELQAQFDRDLADFFTSQGSKQIRPPVAGEQVAERILAVTGALRISTIDALFHEWVSRFPWEAGSHGNLSLPTPFKILDAASLKSLSDLAWSRLFDDQELRKLMLGLATKHKLSGGLLDIKTMVFELARFQTYLWQRTFDGQPPFCQIPVPAGGESNGADVMQEVRWQLEELAAACKTPERFQPAIAALDVDGLVASRLLTRDLMVSKTFFRGAKRDSHSEAIAAVEDVLGRFERGRRTRRLGEISAVAGHVYWRWQKERQKLKKKLGGVEFNDLSKACYQLFFGEKGAGAIVQIQSGIQHLLIDEFQDTSLLQWRIFEEITVEILAQGDLVESGIVKTAFFVGDPKQSIYLFREADPAVMGLARDCLEQFGHQTLPMNRSYRTAQVVLDAVNHGFQRLSTDVETHETATIGDRPVIPNVGRVIVAPEAVGDSARNLSAVQVEAKEVAGKIAHALANSREYPVHVKGTFRPLGPEDICILYRNSTHVYAYEQALREHGISYRKEERKGFFKRAEILDVLALIRYVVYPDELLNLITFLRSPAGGLADRTLIDLLAKNRVAGTELSAVRFLELLRDERPDFGQKLTKLQGLSRRLTPHRWLIAAYDTFAIGSCYRAVFSPDEGQAATSNLSKLLGLVLSLEDDGCRTLKEVVAKLESLRDQDEIGLAADSAGAVTLMTIHKSKGLEFPFVVIVGMGEPWFRSDRYWLKSPDGVVFCGRSDDRPRGLRILDDLLQVTEGALELEAERLLYVAMTRASQYLMLSSYQSRSSRPSLYRRVTDALPQSDQDFVRDSDLTVEPAPEAKRHRSALAFRAVEPALPPDLKLHLPHRMLEHRRSAAPATESPTESRLRGVFVHRCLEEAASGRSYDPEQIWRTEIQASNPGVLPADRWSVFYDLCWAEVLANIDSTRWQALFRGATDIKTEWRIAACTGSYLLRGVIDLVIRYPGDRLIILDYKTMTPPESVDLPDFCREQGFDQQLSAYEQAVLMFDPGVHPSKMVWFTKLQEGVTIPASNMPAALNTGVPRRPMAEPEF